MADQVFSIAEGKFVDKVDDAATTTTDTTNNPDQPIVKDDKLPDAAATDTKVDATKTDTVKTDTKTDTKVDNAATAFAPGDYIKSKFSEQFGIESEEDLVGVLSQQTDLVNKFEELKKTAGTPVYRTDQEKRIAEFLKEYDPSKFGEGLHTAAAIMGMDPDQVAGKVAMQEKYILEHPSLTRDEAKELFDDEYQKHVVNKDKYDDDAQYEKAKKIADIRLKDEESRARNFLREQKTKLKSVEVAKTDTAPAKFELDKPTVESYTQEIEKFMPTFEKIPFKSEDGKDVLFNIVLDKTKQADIKKFMLRHVQNPAAYGDDKKIANFTAPQLAKQALRILHGDWLETQMTKEIKRLAATMKAEQIAEQTPSKKETDGSAGVGKRSQTDQFEELGKKAAEADPRRNR